MTYCTSSGKNIACAYKDFYKICPLHGEDEGGGVLSPTLDSLRISDRDCCICLEGIKNDYVSLKCDHVIHIMCFKQLEAHSIIKCPLCRKLMYDDGVDSDATTEYWTDDDPSDGKLSYINHIYRSFMGIKVYYS